ncbi:MAG: FAD:protein FMN transferase [Gammaproteobacteria bacterium]|nr:FAD:protein FMN transferase [Gammaproteobacteria bacterium]MBT8105108.1 FAD:protein FMN transferase [Gammaproteobacteria bacterium]NNF48666.1 FAD:protein FMN transferase [Woeseiaceae bacterium]NNK25122.1 FAD:protein FMN transferase [Woeseiaceae bacterium]NNL62327.1 FAD:protein FMN transferase [Woeseiaceae bacterium]
MGSPCEVLLEAESRHAAGEAGELVAAEAWRIEDKFSRYRNGNIVHRINHAAGTPVVVDDETARLLDFATTLFGLSDGRFDITSGVLREVWTFDGSDRIPSPDAVEAVLARVGWAKATWEAPELLLQPGMEIDLGGIGKEYAVDRCAATLREHGSAPGLVNFGGDLAVSGPPSRRDAWRVAIEGQQDDQVDRLIDLRAGALATSGDARRYLARGGVRYGHILDPATGWPIPDAPRSITVAANTCTEAGMLSTLAMLRGAEAERFLDEQSVRYWCRR